MAMKVAKIQLPSVLPDSKDANLKDRVLKALEQSYIAGYDLAVKECELDNSKSGFDMQDYLSALEDTNE
jgi:hypothetical protein